MAACVEGSENMKPAVITAALFVALVAPAGRSHVLWYWIGRRSSVVQPKSPYLISPSHIAISYRR
jgi:hypothetical protein